MLKKTMTYENYDGEAVTEDFYFNITKAEIAELQVSKKGGFGESLKAIIKAQDGQQIIDTFKQLILMAVGKKSEDGKRFIKNAQIREEFAQTEAYSDLFILLCTDAKAGADFVQAIVPKGLAELAEAVEQADKERALPEGASAPDEDPRPAWIREDREPTKKELSTMSTEQLQAAFLRKNAVKDAE